MLTSINVISIILGASVVSLVWVSLAEHRRIPPGPPLSLLLKNVFKIRPEYPSITYQAWAKFLRVPLICIKSLGNFVVILDTAEVAFELLDKRSRIYSDRPEWPCADYLGTQNYIGFMYYGERLIKSRKLLHIILNPHAVSQWDGLLDRQSNRLLMAVAKSPERVGDGILQMCESTVLNLVYGRDLQSGLQLHEPPSTSRRVLDSLALQGQWLFKQLPGLAYIPNWLFGSSFARWSWDALELLMSTPRPPFEQVKDDMKRGIADKSFVRNCLEEMAAVPHLDITEESIMYNAGGLHAAAVDTLTSTLTTFYLMMCHHPEIQDRAYAEIQSVVGTERLTTLSDKTSLPYIETIIKELFRYAPPVPLNPHATSSEDEYDGYTIPKKAWVIANIRSMLHNEASYPDPDRFIPDRHAGPNAQRDPNTLAFGFGRRICPGNRFANTFIFLCVSRAIALFKISAAEGSDSTPKLPRIAYSTKFISTPLPFACKLTPRHAGVADLLAEAQSNSLGM